MSNVRIYFEDHFAFIEKEEILVVKVDVTTITLAAVVPYEPTQNNFPSPRSRELVIVSNEVTIRTLVRDENPPDAFGEHSAYALLKTLTENM